MGSAGSYSHASSARILWSRPSIEIRMAGIPVERSRRTVALCRCGGSTIKPFCDGTHKATGFCTPEQHALCRELVEGEGVEYEDLARSFDRDDPGLRESA
ncbi:MAG: CDGSH iron-sulfur domain-containing protein [Actinomycetales bacterium]|nr:CDGSH iron-sulfur domain-containing protein [Actinomycetales bacterium]